MRIILIQQLLLSPQCSSERSMHRASADWDSILKVSSAHLRYWYMHVFICWLNNWTCVMSCADRNGCHEFHCSEYLWCLLYNPVALPYAFPPFIFHSNYLPMSLSLVGSRVHVRSGFWGYIGSSSGGSSGCGTPGTLSISRSLVKKLIDGNSGGPTAVEPWWLWWIPSCRW